MLTMEPKLYTLREAAELLKLSPKTVSRLAHSGQLKAVRIGGRKLYVSDVEIRRICNQGTN